MLDTGFPCLKCGTNPWTDCAHRKAERSPPPPMPDSTIDRSKNSGGGRFRTHPNGNGLNFKTRKLRKRK